MAGTAQLIIGAGATGSGIALDAVTRGLSVALIECNDFASGTSSRSTKLIHGGVRYLEKAITQFDKESWDLVKEAILERRHLINLSFVICTVIDIHLSLCSTLTADCINNWPVQTTFVVGDANHHSRVRRVGDSRVVPFG